MYYNITMISEEAKKAKTVYISKNEYDDLKKKAEYYELYKNNYIDLKAQNQLMTDELNKLRRVVYASQPEKRLIIAKNYDIILNEEELICDKEEEKTGSSERLSAAMTDLIDCMRSFPPNDEVNENINYLFRRFTLKGNQQKCPLCKNKLVATSQFPATTFKITEEKAVLCDDIYYGYKCSSCAYQMVNIYENFSMKNPVINEKIISAETIARIITYKFERHDSMQSQEIFWDECGLDFSSTLMASWMREVCDMWFRPLYDMLKKEIKQNDFICADVKAVRNYDITRNSCMLIENELMYLWLFRTDETNRKPIILFDISQDKSYDIPEKYLKGYKGILQTVKIHRYEYPGKDFKTAAMWQYVAELFDEALDYIPPKAQNDSAPMRGIRLCEKIIGNEAEFSHIEDEIKIKLRNKRSRAAAEELVAWAKEFSESNVDPDRISRTGKALSYIHDHEKELMIYFEDSRVSVDNELCQSSLHNFTVSEKKWKIVRTGSGCERSMMMYSIIQTAVANNLNPFRYLYYYMKNAANPGKHTTMDHLLPWNVPDACKEFYYE